MNKPLMTSNINDLITVYVDSMQLQQTVAKQLGIRASYCGSQIKKILNLGASASLLNKSLNRIYPQAQIIHLDEKTNQVIQKQLRDSPVYAEPQTLPFADYCFDLVFLNLMLQPNHSLPEILLEIQRVLAPGGILLFALPGLETFQELRRCWESGEDNIYLPEYLDMHDLGDLLQQLRFQQVVVDVQHISVNYPDFSALLADVYIQDEDISHQIFKAAPLLTNKVTTRSSFRRQPESKRALRAGARSALCIPQSSCGMTRGEQLPNKLYKLEKNYEEFKNAEGKLPVTYEIIYSHAQAPLQQTNADNSEILIPVASIGKK